jgi:two-component system LytT family sensor kinase
MTQPSRQGLLTHGNLFWLVQVAGWTAYGLSTFLTLLPSLPEGQRGTYLAAKLLRAAAGFGASLVLYRLYGWLRERKASPPAVLACALVACGVLGAIWLLVYRVGIAPRLLPTPPPFGWEIFPRAALDLVFVLAAWSGIYFGALHWNTIQRQERRLLEVDRLAQEARFQMLSYQLNPHFLFNSLNSLRALIGEDRERAKEMVTQLAEFLRYTLTRDPTRFVTVREEMEAVASYLSIEATRFEERLSVASEVAPMAEECLLPGFLVHPLVENAVKYGARSPEHPLRIRIRVDTRGPHLRVEVSNSGRLRGRESAASGTGMGWRIIRGRLEHLFPGAHRFDFDERDGWVTATVEVPAIRHRAEVISHA